MVFSSKLFRPNIEKLKENNDLAGLIKALKHGDSSVRCDAIAALRSIGDPGAVGSLLKVLNDTDWNVRMKTINALGKIADRTAVEPLIKALKDQDKAVREAAANALWRIGDPAGVEAVRTAEPPNDVKFRRKQFARQHPDIVQCLEDLPVLAEDEELAAVQLALGRVATLRASTDLDKWGKACQEEIIDILATCGRFGHFKEHPYGGGGPLECMVAELTFVAVGNLARLVVIGVRSRDYGGYSCRGDLHLLRVSEKEYLYFFAGQRHFAGPGGLQAGEFNIP